MNRPKLPGRRLRATAAGCLLLGGLVSIPPASGDGPPTIALPETIAASYNGQTHVTTISVTPNGSTSVQVNLAVDHGDLTLASTSGLTFASGDGTQDATVTFTGTNANVDAALADVTYRPGTYVGAATLTGQVTDAGSLYFAETGHLYEFVASNGISWTAARDAAAARSLYGLTGYLVTVTSATENAFVAGKLSGQGWMGATDTAVEGEWRWVTGPEGLEQSGSGRVFFRDNSSCDGATGFTNGPVNSEYNNWAAGEPNDSGCEDYAHFLNNAQWNDYPHQLGNIAGYVVEYGGLPGETSTISTDSSAITVSAVVPGAPTLTTAAPGENKITASWTAPADNGGAAITGYTVTANPGGHTANVGGGVTSTDVTGLDGGTTFTVTVAAANSVGTGPASNSLEATPTGGVVPTTTTTAAPTTTTTAAPTSSTTAAPATTTTTTTATPTTTTTPPATPPAALPGDDESAPPVPPGVELVAVAPTPDGEGSWGVAADGGVFTDGSARYFGSLAGTPLSAPIVGISPTPSGQGYFLVGADGGVFAFGDAAYRGSLAGMALAAPVAGIATTCDGDGYYLVGADGGVFAFGGARYFGSMAGVALNGPVMGIVPTCSGGGYRLWARDGGVFSFGDAGFFGSLGSDGVRDVEAFGVTPSEKGYWLRREDDTLHHFGDST